MLDTCAVRAGTVDCGELYEVLRGELIDLVRSLAASDLERPVAATPAWRVRDVLAHVVGITADLNSLRFDVADGDAWTARQVTERRESDIEAIVGEWDRESPLFEDGLRLLGYEIGSHYVADLHAHLQDVRSALGLPAHDTHITVLVSLDFFLGSLDEALREARAGSVSITAGDEKHIAGDGAIQASVQAEPFELLRVLSARRSPAQIRSLEWAGDLDPIIEIVARYPLPERDLFD